MGDPGQPPRERLASRLAACPCLGTLEWRGGEAGPVPCELRVLRASLRFSRSGRQADYTEATLHFVQVLPREGALEPWVLATTLPVSSSNA